MFAEDGPVAGRSVSRPLVDLALPLEEKNRLLAELESAVSCGNAPCAIRVSEHEYWDLLLLATGAYTPLDGYLSKENYFSVLESCRLSDGALWSIPICLSLNEADARALASSDRGAVVLLGPAGRGPSEPKVVRLQHEDRPLGVVEVDEIFSVDPLEEARAVYRTDDPQHPGVARLLSDGTYRLAGKVKILAEFESPYAGYPFTPAETRKAIAEMGWRHVVAFQTRNPIHRAHEYLCKCALEVVDGLMIHPVVGTTKDDDVPAEVRMRCYEVLVENYFPKDRVLVACFPSPMRYAGPREALHHLLVRRNYGATHMIIGRDHAGVGNYYGTYEAQEFVSSFDSAELGIQPLFFEHAFYCNRCESMATSKTCGHDESARMHLSGTKVRQMLAEGVDLPATFTRREVAEVLAAAYKDKRIS
jgi:sulfate adenylyltransferase